MSADDRRKRDRSRFDLTTDLFYRGFRFVLGHVKSFRAAVGVFLIAGAVAAALGIWAFVAVADLGAEFYGDARTPGYPEDMAVNRLLGGLSVTTEPQTTITGFGAVGAQARMSAHMLSARSGAEADRPTTMMVSRSALSARRKASV